MKKKRTKSIYVVLIVIFLVIFSLWVYRFFSSRQIDDVSSGIGCERELLDKSDVLFVIPKYKNVSISENKSWCEYILSLNKTLAMHGVYHTYKEFNIDRDEEYLNEGREIFYACFGFYPTEFKAPQLSINNNNKKLISSKMRFIGYFNQLFHKAYHCEDTGQLSNRFMDIV
jgi:hypothetical protein